MKKERTKAWVIAAMAAVGALVLVFSRTAVIEAIYPVERAKNSIVGTVAVWTAGLFNGAAACVENRALKRELDSLKMVRGDMERMSAENARLRKALGYVERERGNWLAAGVLSTGGGAAAVHDTLRIDKGGNDGVRPGLAVAVPEGLVGIVDSVTPHTAEVTLISDESIKIACDLNRESGFFGVLAGNGDGEMVVRYMKGDAERHIGSEVYTSGRGGVFPKGILVGRLVSVKKDELGEVSEGVVTTPVDYMALKDVFIRCEK